MRQRTKRAEGLMTPGQVRLIQGSFHKVLPVAGRLAEAFHARLFLIAPDTRILFKGDLEGRYDQYLQMLLWLVMNLHQIEAIPPAVEELDRRYLQYEMATRHASQFAKALIDSHRQILSEAFMAEIRYAWITAFGLLAEKMQDEAKGPSADGVMSASMLEGTLIAFYGVIGVAEASNDDLETLKSQRPGRNDDASDVFWRS